MGIFGKGKRTKKDKIFTTERASLSRFKMFDSLNMYTRLFAEKYTGGIMDTPTETIEDGKFYYATNRIFTQKVVKKMIFLQDLPPELPRGFVSDIRTNVQKAVRAYNETHGSNEHVSIGLVLNSEFYDLDLGSKRVQGRWTYFTREYEKVQKKAGNKSLQDELKSDKYSDGVRRKVSSFLYIKEAKDEQDASFFKTKAVLEFVASSDDVLEEAEREFRGYVYRHRIKPKEVFIQTNEYQKSFTPMGVAKNSLLKKMHVGDVWADDTISSFSVSTHGIVGDKTGIYHGVDVQSRNVLAIDMSKGSDAQNILLTAGTGEGKSNYAKMLYTFIVPLTDTYSTIVYDYEGTEYLPLGQLARASIVSMTGGEGSYVNTMVIGDLTGVRDIDKNLRIEAMESTERVFNLLVDERDGMSPSELSLFSDCLNAVYNDFGVHDDPNTWKNSKRCTFYHIYAKMIKMKESNDIMYAYGEEVVLDFIIKLKPYFEKGGIRTHWFLKPISIQDIVDSQHLIISFGMGSETEGMIDEKSLALRQLFASYLTVLMASKNKAKGLRTVIFLEELQRYLKHRYSGEIVSRISSGGRKLGMIVYYITNAPSELLMLAESGDKNVRSNASIVMSNITTTIIGALWKNDMDRLIPQFGLENARGVLYQLAEVKEANKDNSDMKYCFFVRYKGQSTVVRMLSHPSLEELPLYTTLKDAGDGNKEEQDKQKRLRMNVGEDAIQRTIDSAAQKEDKRQQNGEDWKTRLGDSETAAVLWKER